jgi:addiction module HigA family antidote
MSIELHPSFAVHPGAWLRIELVEPHGLTVTEAAAKLHVTRQAMSNLLGGRAGLLAEMAVRFDKTFGVRADTLMRMQGAHDLTQVRAREGEIEVERVAA